MAAATAFEEDLLSPLEIVFSCNICHIPLSQIRSEKDPGEGLRTNGAYSNNNEPVKLWLCECAHLSCASHFPGGGIPFYPESQPPKAPCPRCLLDKNDPTEKKLFHVGGMSKGQYDPSIPELFFRPPQLWSGQGGPEMEALRFHYLSLARFATDMHAKNKKLQKAFDRWDSKKDEIIRTLQVTATLKQELVIAWKRLRDLNEDVSSIERVLQPYIQESTQPTLSNQKSEIQDEASTLRHSIYHKDQKPQSAIKVADWPSNMSSLNDKPHEERAYSEPFYISPESPNTYGDQPSMKRQRIQSRASERFYDNELAAHNSQSVRSRDLMPPPPRPSSFLSPRRESRLGNLPSQREERYLRNPSIPAKPLGWDTPSALMVFPDTYVDNKRGAEKFSRPYSLESHSAQSRNRIETMESLRPSRADTMVSRIATAHLSSSFDDNHCRSETPRLASTHHRDYQRMQMESDSSFKSPQIPYSTPYSPNPRLHLRTQTNNSPLTKFGLYQNGNTRGHGMNEQSPQRARTAAYSHERCQSDHLLHTAAHESLRILETANHSVSLLRSPARGAYSRPAQSRWSPAAKQQFPTPISDGQQQMSDPISDYQQRRSSTVSSSPCFNHQQGPQQQQQLSNSASKRKRTSHSRVSPSTPGFQRG